MATQAMAARKSLGTTGLPLNTQIAITELSAAVDTIQVIHRLNKFSAHELVEFGAKIAAANEALTTIDKSVRDLLKDRYSGDVAGFNYTAVISDVEREQLDSKALKAALSPRLWRPYVTIVTYSMVNYKPR